MIQSSEFLKKLKLQPWYEYGSKIAVLVLIGIFLRSSVIRAYKIPSSSMIPALRAGDRIMVNKLAYGLHLPFTKHYLLRFGKPEPGEVIVFISPVDRKNDSISRVIATEEQTVEIRKKKIYVDGRAINDSHALFVEGVASEEKIPRDDLGPRRVPIDHVFVMGDNRDKSYDSRFWGFVDLGDVKGKVFLVYGALNHDGSVDWDRVGTWIE
jgi:signal peptidase I